MTLKARVLRATFSLPGGDVVLNETLDLQFRIRKAALAIQNRASVVVFGMSKTLREQLLSQFTAWNKRVVESGLKDQKWINVVLEAGYKDDTGVENASVVFKGQVVLVNLINVPPDIGVEIQCYTRQIDRTSFITGNAPVKTTFREYVNWAAKQMGLFEGLVFDSDFGDTQITNPSSGSLIVGALLVDIQNARRPDVAAFIDDDVLYVKDRGKIIQPAEIAEVKELIGIPTWTEWGVEFETLLNNNIRLARAAKVTSAMNPSLNGTYVIVSLEYELTSRDTPFYVKALGAPPAE